MAFVMSDTDVLVDAIRGVQPQRSILDGLVQRGELMTNAVTMFELELGARAEAQRERMEFFLASIPILPFEELAAKRAGQIMRFLSAAGLSIDRADAMIAGIALTNGVPLLTRNIRHFERVPGLRVITL